MPTPTIAGRWVVRPTFEGTGTLSSAAVTSSTLGSKEVESCVEEVSRRMTLPPTPGGRALTVSLPIVFSPR